MTSLEAVESYCTPYETPIWMGDFSFKPIGEIQKGDIIIGFCDKDGDPENFSRHRENKLRRTKVLSVKCKYDRIIKIKLMSGNYIRCTADHQWLTKRYKSGLTESNRPKTSGWNFNEAKENWFLARVIEPTCYPDKSLSHLAGWLSGMYDGEGCKELICQSKSHNPLVYEKIDWACEELGFRCSETKKGWFIKGGRQAFVDFMNICKPFRSWYFEEKILCSTLLNPPDRIISIEDDGYDKVYCLETEIGSYIAWGYASKNSAFHSETFEELLEWPYRRFIKAFSSWQKRRAIDEIENRKNIYIGALLSIVEWKEEGDKEKAIENVEQYYEALKDVVWEPDKHLRENREMKELEESDSFLRAGKRNIQKIIPVQIDLPGQKNIENQL